jgi:hypothetical protein
MQRRDVGRRAPFEAIVFGLVACGAKPAPVPPTDPPIPRTLESFVGKPAPRFSLPSARGDATFTVPSAEVTVVTFFGTWSLGWQIALPKLEALRQKHPGLRVLAASMDDENPKAVAERYAAVPIAWSGGMATPTNAEWLSRPYGGENKVFVLDRKGTIRFVHRGGKEHTVFATPSGQETVEDEVNTLLAEP